MVDVMKDPVCGMDVEEEDPELVSGYKGKSYRFCSALCKQKFDKKPEDYAN